MSYRIIVSPNGKRTFNAICDQLRDRWNVKTVNQFKLIVTKAMKKAAENPYLYQVYNEELGLRQCVLHRNCAMLYQIRQDHIWVAYFWDTRQDPIFLP